VRVVFYSSSSDQSPIGTLKVFAKIVEVSELLINLKKEEAEWAEKSIEEQNEEIKAAET
jgi:hypothetical protein